MKPICVPCGRFYRAKKNGFYFLEGMPTTEWDGKSGKDSEGWTPYKLLVGDLYECPNCHAQTVVGVPQSIIAEHYEKNFTEIVEHFKPTLFVKDC